MQKQFKVGEYVHLPEQVMVWDLDEKGNVKSYVKTVSPVALMVVGVKQDPKFAEKLYDVFYEGRVLSVAESCVYQIKEKEGE